MSEDQKNHDTSISSNENQKPDTQYKEPDWFLSTLVGTVNKTQLSIGITLNVGGLLVSGQLIGGKAYFEEFAKEFKLGFINGGMDEEFADDIEANYKSLGELYNPPDEKNAGASQPVLYIHLRNAKFLPSSFGGSVPSPEGVLWRGRLDAVGGFSLGNFF